MKCWKKQIRNFDYMVDSASVQILLHDFHRCGVELSCKEFQVLMCKFADDSTWFLGTILPLKGYRMTYPHELRMPLILH